jgi:hypothetical protein
MIDLLKQQLAIQLPYIHIYGEGRQVRNDNLPGVVYVDENLKPCAVNNLQEGVIFWVKNTAEKDADGFGNWAAKRKVTNYTLAAASKSDISATILSIVNDLRGFDWSSESWQQSDIGQNFFGLSQVNLDTYFYTLEFTVVENIACKSCR